MEIQLTIEENKLIIFNNHWKSKSGGALETEPARNAAAAILNKRIGELVQSSPGTPIIIAGDLNETLPGEEGAPPVYLTALTNIKDFEAFPMGLFRPGVIGPLVPISGSAGHFNTAGTSSIAVINSLVIRGQNLRKLFLTGSNGKRLIIF